MRNLSIPTCYFPSTVLFLDDNRDFLLNFVLQLDESVAYRIFDNPTKALTYIQNKNCEFEFLHQNCIGEFAEAKQGYLTHQEDNAELAAINAEVYNPNRFSEVSVVVVDYAMPGMDGLEFCKRIENPNIKKILLSGQADEVLAVEAFNAGLIDRYIKKNEANASELITQSIFELQKQYFQAMSEEIERVLSINPPNCLKEKNFINLFEQIVAEHRVVEYYLADYSGSFFMLDDDANISFLIVKNEQEMQAYQELALAHGAGEEVITELSSRKKIPALWSSNKLNLTRVDWISSLFPASELTAQDTYYYAYLKGNDLLNIRQQKILSYHRYLDELDAEELLLV